MDSGRVDPDEGARSTLTSCPFPRTARELLRPEDSDKPLSPPAAYRISSFVSDGDPAANRATSCPVFSLRNTHTCPTYVSMSTL